MIMFKSVILSFELFIKLHIVQWKPSIACIAKTPLYRKVGNTQIRINIFDLVTILLQNNSEKWRNISEEKD